MINRHQTIYVEKFQRYDFCGREFIHFDGGTYELPFQIEPTKGDHNFKTCSNCKANRDKLAEEIKERLDKFPFCCERHSRLSQLAQFRKEDFDGLELDYANRVFYTHHHIINYLDIDNWYDEITNYIDYTIESYGSFPPNYGPPFELGNYFAYTKELLINVKKALISKIISKTEIHRRVEVILKFLKSYENPIIKEDKRDLNLVLSIYDRWFKIFPFELSYFQHLKPKFEQTFPVLEAKPKFNPYLGLSTAKVIKAEKMIEFVIKTTKNILSEINALELYEKGELTNTDKIALELIVQKRKLELKQTGSTYDGRHSAYVKTIRKWFRDEQRFIKDIKPFLNNAKPSNNTRPYSTDIAYCVYYLSITKELNLENSFPSGRAWEEIGTRYNKNAKNIETMYNLIASKKEERLKKTKLKNIKFVLENMLSNYPKAKELAKDELKLAKLNL